MGLPGRTTSRGIIETARETLGTPFRHQGRIAGQALDCAGLIVHVATSHNFKISDMEAYPELPNGELEAVLAQHVAAGAIRRITLSEMQPGDIVLMRFEKEPAPRHLGILGYDNTLIHAWAVTGKVCEHLIDAAWRRRIVGAWRFEGVKDGE